MRWKLEECPYPIKFKERKPKTHPEIKNFNDLLEDQKIILLEIKNYVKSVFLESKLFLVGSRISGRWDQNSDYDIIIECDCEPEKINKIKNYDFGVKLDLIFLKKNHVKNNVEIR